MIYIASESKPVCAAVARAFASRLAAEGITVTSHWHEQTDKELAATRSPAELRTASEAAARDIRRSRIVVAFLAQASREALAVGAFAVGAGIPVIFVGYPSHETIILDQGNVWCVDFFGDAFDMVKEQHDQTRDTIS